MPSNWLVWCRLKELAPYQATAQPNQIITQTFR